MLLGGGEHVEACLVSHLLLLELSLEPVADGLMQRGRLFLNSIAMGVDLFNHAERL